MHDFALSLWSYLIISAPYLMLGILLSGIIHQFLTIESVKRTLGKKDMGSVVKASLIGIPLPLCSCAVIPTAVTLKKSGASNGATSSFLISTPESGVDSIAVTYAMMDLPMTILRPLAGFVSATVAGFCQLFFKTDILVVEEKSEVSCCPSRTKSSESKTFQIKKIFSYALFDLLEDMALWLSFGLLLGASIQHFTPADLFQSLAGPWQRFIILGVGIPVYICASATTPIAASLVVKGMSPGCALLLLLVGPATNISNIMVLQKYLGKKAVIINIVVIALVSLGFSYLVDFLYASQEWGRNFKISEHHHETANLFEVVITIIFLAFLMRANFMELKQKFLKKKKCH